MTLLSILLALVCAATMVLGAWFHDVGRRPLGLVLIALGGLPFLGYVAAAILASTL